MGIEPWSNDMPSAAGQDHCALESYSVLTRLPAPHRCPGAVARDFLGLCFAEPLSSVWTLEPIRPLFWSCPSAP
jgi:hypothetical protein